MFPRLHRTFVSILCAVCVVMLHAQANADLTQDFWEWYDDAKETAYANLDYGWYRTKQWCDYKWGQTKQWCSDHKEEIYTGVAVAVAVTAYVLTQNDSSSPYNADRPSSNGYSFENNPSLIEPGRPFTQSQKSLILQQNMERNGGVLRSDLSGKELVMPQQCKPGVTPNPLEAQIDHVYPRSLGGPNSAANAQVLSREENILKSNHVD